MQFKTILGWAIALCAGCGSTESTIYFNPVLSGWHSDPSCVQVNGTVFCATSSFISFPGIPIYASDDLLNWRLVSHVWTRESQLPGISWNTSTVEGGLWAPTLRYHNNEFYLSTVYVVSLTDAEIIGLVFKTGDIFNLTGWSNPVQFDTSYTIDPDLFWDDDETLYVATSGIQLQTLDLDTGKLGESIRIWNGTGGSSPEGPHFYKKDGWYYLMIAEGGTNLNHSITIARAQNITGPYISYEQNPILTNRGTDQYFQTVGHGDLFQDADGNWWGMCLTTRSGPAYEVYPMGREAALFPASWEEGQWPVLQPVRGVMSAPEMPAVSRNVSGNGPFNSDPDVYDFNSSSTTPLNFVYVRSPENPVVMTERGMQIVPSRSNLTGVWDAEVGLTGQHGLGFIGRTQTDTYFNYSVELVFHPQEVGEEAGVSVLLTQHDHIDLGIICLDHANQSTPSNRTCDGEGSNLYFRFGTQREGNSSTPVFRPVPANWATQPIRLEIMASNNSYILSATLASDTNSRITIGEASANIVSGGSGRFVGSLVGGFATCNGAGTANKCPHDDIAYFQTWRYTGMGQLVTSTKVMG